jgi:hypothetical protein
LRWWQPLVILLDLYLIASVAPWLAVTALRWSLRHSSRSLDNVVGYLDKLQQTLREQTTWWSSQPRFGPYAPPMHQAEVLLSQLMGQLAIVEHLALPLRNVSLPRCSLAQVLTCRCWAVLVAIYAIWRSVRRLAYSLGDIVPNMSSLREAQVTIESFPSDSHAQLALRQYDLEQIAARLKNETDAGTTGLELLQKKCKALADEINKLQGYLVHHADNDADASPALTGSIAAISTDIGEISQNLTQMTQQRQQAEANLDQMASIATTLRDRWHAVLRQGVHSQPMEERLIGLESQLDEARTRLQPHSREAYLQVITSLNGFAEFAKSLADEMAGYENDIAQADAAMHAAASDLTAGKDAITKLHAQYVNVNADASSERLDQAAELLARASEIRQLGTLEGVHHANELALQVRQVASTAIVAIDGLEQRVRDVFTLWVELKRGDMSPWRKQLQFLVEKLQGYPKHYTVAKELERNIETSLREVDLAIGCLPEELVKGGYFRESHLDDASEALAYAKLRLQYVSEGIILARAALEHIEQQRLQLEQDVAMLLYVDLPSLEQLTGTMLPELRDRCIQTALSIRQEAANLLDPLQTEYDEALRYGLPYLRRQLDEVRASHATHIKQLQLQYEAEKGTLARSWALLERVDPSHFQFVSQELQQLQADYRTWQQTAENSQQNPLLLSQTLGRRSSDLQQRMLEMHRTIVEGKLALRELEKLFQQRYSQAEALRTRVAGLCNASAWPHLVWNVETERAWARIGEAQRRIDSADSLPSLLDAWQHAVSACNETIRLCERYENQIREALGHLQDELKAVTALRQRVQSRAEELSAKQRHTESRKLTKLVNQVDNCVNLSRSEADFDAALRHLRQARDMLNRL